MIQSLSDSTWYSPARRRRDTTVWETLIRPLLLPATCVMRVGTADTTSQQTAYTMAKAGLRIFLETGTADNDSTQVPIPEEQATLLIKNKVVNHSPTASLRIAHRAPAIQKHLCERMQWEVSTFKAVHWDSYYRAFKKRDVNSQTRLLKYIYGWLPVDHIRQRIDPDKPDFCPSCRGRNVTSSHIIRCREHKRLNLFNLQISEIREHLEKGKTHGSITESLISGLCGWHQNPNYQQQLPNQLTTVSRSLRKAVTDHNNIGWGGLYSGHISIDYQTAHNQEQERTTDRPANLVTLSDWTTPLITLL